MFYIAEDAPSTKGDNPCPHLAFNSIIQGYEMRVADVAVPIALTTPVSPTDY
jgi:hypothetical protein